MMMFQIIPEPLKICNIRIGPRQSEVLEAGLKLSKTNSSLSHDDVINAAISVWDRLELCPNDLHCISFGDRVD